MKVAVRVDNMHEFLSTLESFPDLAVKPLEDATVEAMRYVGVELGTNYPPELPGQTYIRTLDLASGWTNAIPQHTALGGFNFIAFMSNDDAPYVGYVQDQDNQSKATTKDGASIFVGRWKTAQEYLKDEEILNTVAGIYESQLQVILREFNKK